MEVLVEAAKLLNFGPLGTVVVIGAAIWMYRHTQNDEEREEKMIKLQGDTTQALTAITQMVQFHEKRLDRIEKHEDDVKV